MHPSNHGISVIIPLYNKESYVKRAINSVISQTYQNFEIIVVDDGSTDSGIKIVNSIKDQRIRLIQQKNRGASAARNTGVRNSKSPDVTFLDADDEWLPNFLETVVRLEEKYPSCGIYATNVRKKSAKIITLKRRINENAYEEGLIKDYFNLLLNGINILSSSSVMIPKRVFQEEGGFNEEAFWGEDEDLWWRIALRYRIAFSHRICSQIYDLGTSERYPKRFEKTKQHPFIKSSITTPRNGKATYSESDLREFVMKLLLYSAINNMEMKDRNTAKKNISKCDTRRFSFFKYYLLIWLNAPLTTFNLLYRSGLFGISINTLSLKYKFFF